MPRGDGRIEPGQRLSGAISARAWNRAQDAADLVLGTVPSVSVGPPSASATYIAAAIKIPAATTEYPHCGVAIKLTTAEWDAPSSSTLSWPRPATSARVRWINGQIAAPRDLVTAETQSTLLPEMFAVTVEPIAIGQTVVRCAIAGVVMAAIRNISSSHRYAALPTLRSSLDSASANTGLLETSDSGYAVILARQGGWALVKL